MTMPRGAVGLCISRVLPAGDVLRVALTRKKALGTEKINRGSFRFKSLKSPIKTIGVTA